MGDDHPRGADVRTLFPDVAPVARGRSAAGRSLAWGFTELPNLAVVLIVTTTWARASAREARRHDRSEDRSGEADRRAYNEWLSSMPQ